MVNAVKNFLWRACNNLLPTKMNLMRRGIVKDARCPICEREAETMTHILWRCSAAQDEWGCEPKKLQKGIDEGLTFAQVLTTMIGRFDMEEIELMAVMAQKIWFRRNAMVRGGDFIHPDQVFRSTSSSLDDFRWVNGCKEPYIRSTTNTFAETTHIYIYN